VEAGSPADAQFALPTRFGELGLYGWTLVAGLVLRSMLLHTTVQDLLVFAQPKESAWAQILYQTMCAWHQL
jgi:hypothetical protein